MFCKWYVEAILVNAELAGAVWNFWYSGETDDETTCIAWMLIAGVCSGHDKPARRDNDV
jgi:hypothetical protein